MSDRAVPAANDRAPMFRVSLILEVLRARPALMFWVAALAQGALWTLVPSLFYAAPPGDVPLVLAVGHELPLGSPYGPPLAFWLAEPGVRARRRQHRRRLSCCRRLCVVVTYWAVFALGRRIVGAAHAAMAILLMAGISVFTVPTLGIRPDRAGDAADRAGAPVLLSRARRQPAARLGRCSVSRSGCCCSRPTPG